MSRQCGPCTFPRFQGNVVLDTGKITFKDENDILDQYMMDKYLHTSRTQPQCLQYNVIYSLCKVLAILLRYAFLKIELNILTCHTFDLRCCFHLCVPCLRYPRRHYYRSEVLFDRTRDMYEEDYLILSIPHIQPNLPVFMS